MFPYELAQTECSHIVFVFVLTYLYIYLSYNKKFLVMLLTSVNPRSITDITFQSKTKSAGSFHPEKVSRLGFLTLSTPRGSPWGVCAPHCSRLNLPIARDCHSQMGFCRFSFEASFYSVIPCYL